MTSQSSDLEPLAIVGIGCRVPGARGPAELWNLLVAGRCTVTEVTRWDTAGIASRRAGLVDDVDRFDAAFFGISPRDAAHMDPQHRVLLEVAWETLEDAGVPAHRLTGERVGVFVGITTADYLELNAGHVDTYSATGKLATFAANRVSYGLDLRGPSLGRRDTRSPENRAARDLSIRILCIEIDSRGLFPKLVLSEFNCVTLWPPSSTTVAPIPDSHQITQFTAGSVKANESGIHRGMAHGLVGGRIGSRRRVGVDLLEFGLLNSF
jgi:hypothetical protein